MWKITKKLRSDTAASSNRSIHGINGLRYTAADKAETVPLSMEDQFQINDHLLDLATEDLVAESSTDSAPGIAPDFVTPAETAAVIATFKTGSAPGPDPISNRALKLLPEKLTNIFNARLRLTYFPIAGVTLVSLVCSLAWETFSIS